MILPKIGALFSAALLIFAPGYSQDDASLYCLDNTPFCQRTREWKID